MSCRWSDRTARRAKLEVARLKKVAWREFAIGEMIVKLKALLLVLFLFPPAILLRCGPQ